MKTTLKIPRWLDVIVHVLHRDQISMQDDLEARLAQIRQEQDLVKRRELKQAMVTRLGEYDRDQSYSIIAAYYRDMLDAYLGLPDIHNRSKYHNNK